MSPETDEQEIEQCEQFCFHFDQPHSNNHGNVLITQNNVKIVFPQTTTNNANNTLRPNINFFFNNQQVFSYDWLPIHTNIDLMRIYDMLFQSYNVHKLKTKYVPINSFLDGYFKLCNYKNFTVSNDTFKLYCYKDIFTTSIYLDITKKESIDSNSACIHLQICFGDNIVFCTKRDLAKHAQTNQIHFLIQFLLLNLKP
jgi:hypothetical protein